MMSYNDGSSKKRLFNKISQRTLQEPVYRVDFVKRRRFMFKGKVEKMALIGTTESATGKAVKLLAFSNTFEEYVLLSPVILF